MTAKTYRKKPVTVEAIQWTGDNFEELRKFVGTFRVLAFDEPGVIVAENSETHLWVEANQQWLPIVVSEWVLKDKLGYYPCKDEMFQHSYEETP